MHYWCVSSWFGLGKFVYSVLMELNIEKKHNILLLIDQNMAYSRFLGVWIFYMGKNKRLIVSNLLAFYLTVICIMCFAFSYPEVKILIFNKRSLNAFTIFRTTTIFTIGTVICVFGISQLLYMKAFSLLFNELMAIESIISSFPRPLSTTAPTWAFFFINASFLLIRICVFCIDTPLKHTYEWLIFFHQVWLCILFQGILFTFNLIIFAVEEFFSILISVSHAIKSELALKLKISLKLIKCHSLLSSVCERIGTIFSPLHFMSTVVLFLFVVFESYNLVLKILNDDKAYRFLNPIAWCGFAFGNLFYIINPIVRVSKKVIV